MVWIKACATKRSQCEAPIMAPLRGTSNSVIASTSRQHLDVAFWPWWLHHAIDNEIGATGSGAGVEELFSPAYNDFLAERDRWNSLLCRWPPNWPVRRGGISTSHKHAQCI